MGCRLFLPHFKVDIKNIQLMFSYFRLNQVSSEDATGYTELVSAAPMTHSGPKEEVKLGLRNAIRTRRVAQGLEGMPSLEPKRPKIESVSNRLPALSNFFLFRSPCSIQV